MKRPGTKFAASVLVTLGVTLASSAQAIPARRFALLIANNEGGAGTSPLRYAEADAQKMRNVLMELGGYQQGDIITLLGQEERAVSAALDNLEERIRGAKGQAHTTLLLYYSGHAKAGALRMGDSTLDMKQLRARLSASVADVRIGVLDSCESGAITREKGGRRGPSFLFEINDRDAARGLVLISSSSANEASQESDDLAGSFFTHYLASGLRGDADESGDQRVTLGEVYFYAYNKTVAVTTNTRSGPQHPTYSYDLKGQGDIVLSDLSQGASGVLFPEALDGSYLIFDMGREQVAAEITKQAGSERRISIPPGDYAVKKRLQDHLLMSRFSISRNNYFRVDEPSMEQVAFEDDYAKGIASKLELERTETRLTLRAVGVYQGFFSGRTRSELIQPLFLAGLSGELSAILGGHLSLDVLAGSLNNATVSLGEAGMVGYNMLQVQASLGIHWRLNLGPIGLFAGPRVAGIYLRRTFPEDQQLDGITQDHFGVSPQISLGANWYIDRDRDFSLGLLTRAGYLAFSVDENRSLFYGELGLTLGYRL